MTKGEKMNLENIGSGAVPEKVHAIIEIPFKSDIKYEIDKENDIVVVDRIMRSSVFYPANYGFIPSTLADDGDPLDILVLNEYPFQAGSLVKVRILGVLIMEDESGMDEKILSVAISKIDPTYDNVKSYKDLPKSVIEKIKNFFETYKMLEPDKWVKVKDFRDVEDAVKIVEQSIANYKK